MPVKLKWFLFLCIWVQGCRQPSTSDHLTIATLKGPSSMGMIRLIDSLSRENPASLQVKILDEPMLVRKMMIDGSADFAILPSLVLKILAIARR